MGEFGTIAGIALKTTRHAPMRLVDEATISAETGLGGSVSEPASRQVTFISEAQWRETMEELGADLPWHTRRANILIAGLRMPELLGKAVSVGALRVRIFGETEPCGVMDRAYLGLRNALKPGCRGGVYGAVEAGGTIRLGDTVSVIA